MKLSKRVIAGVVSAIMMLSVVNVFAVTSSSVEPTIVPTLTPTPVPTATPTPVPTATPTPAPRPTTAPAPVVRPTTPSTPSAPAAPAAPAATPTPVPEKLDEETQAPANEAYYSAKLTDENFKELVDEDVVEFFEEFNKGEKEEKDLAEAIALMARMTKDPELKALLQGAFDVADKKEAVTGFTALLWKDNATKVLNENGKYEIILSNPKFVKDLKNPVFLHYAVNDEGIAYFEAVEPKSYDEEAKAFTLELNPVEAAIALFADK